MKIKRRTLVLLKTWAIRFLILGGSFALVYTYWFTNVFLVTSYDLRGIDDRSLVKVRSDLDVLATQTRFLIIPNNKIFTFNSSRIIDAVRTTVTDAKTVDVRPVGLHTVRITVTSLTPLFRSNDQEVLTEDGIIFSSRNDTSALPLLSIASSTTETIKKDGLYFKKMASTIVDIEGHFLKNLAELSVRSSSIIFEVSSINIDETGDITMSDKRGLSRLYLSKDADTKKLWSTLVSAIDTDPLKTKLATNKDSLLYIDARYGNKVFYKFGEGTFQNTKDTAIMNNHATTSSSTLPVTR